MGRWLLRFALAAAATTVGAVLLFAFENWRAERAWQRYQSSLIAQGQRFDPAAFVPPPVPDDQNFLKAPLIRDWFVSDRTAPGLGPPRRILAITRPGDERLLGAWSDCRPTDLTEWRNYFRPVRRPPARATSESPDPTGAEPRVPLIEMDDVPLHQAIVHLAREAGCNFRFDPSAINPAEGGSPLGDARISIRFEQVTFREALDAVLENYGLALVKTLDPSVLCVTKAPAQAPVWPDEALDLDTAPLPAVVEESVSMVVTDQVPPLDAVRNVARHMTLNFCSDPEIIHLPLSTNCYSVGLTNVTGREVLARVLGDNGLALKETGHPSVFRVVRARGLARSAPIRQYYSAAAVLESFDSFDEEFRALYAACERPRSRMDVDCIEGHTSGGFNGAALT